MTATEIEGFFDRDGDAVTVKSWIKEGIEWNVGNAAEPEILIDRGPKISWWLTIFFVIWMNSMAERCLRNIARLVSPHGYLFVSGIDLDIRTKVANDLGWKPLQELVEEVHEGDPGIRSDWPCHYVGLEPLNKKRQDWRTRYATAFQLVPSAEVARGGEELAIR